MGKLAKNEFHIHRKDDLDGANIEVGQNLRVMYKDGKGVVTDCAQEQNRLHSRQLFYSNISIGEIICEGQEDGYGKDATIDQEVNRVSAYHATRGTAVFAAACIHSVGRRQGLQ